MEPVTTVVGGTKKNIGMPPFSVNHVLRKGVFSDRPKGADVLILGDSHGQLWEGNEDLLKVSVVNMAIGGDLTDGVIDILPIAVAYQPKNVILTIGSNNLGWNSKQSVNFIIPQITQIVTILLAIQDCRVFMHPILPVLNVLAPALVGGRTPTNLTTLNALIQVAAANFNRVNPGKVVFIDHSAVLSINFSLLPEVTLGDGCHLNREGYSRWASLLNPYFRNGYA